MSNHQKVKAILKNMMKPVCIAIFFLFYFSSTAQEASKIDSLLMICQKMPDDTNKVNLLLTIGDEYEYSNPSSARYYYKKALDIAVKIKADFYESNCLEYLGILYQNGFAKYDSSLFFYEKCLKIRKNLFGNKGYYYAVILNNIAGLYCNMGQYADAETLYDETIRLRKEIFGENSLSYATSLNNLAVLYYLTGQYTRSEKLYSETNKVYRNLLGENHADYANSLNNLALLYKEMGNFQAAENLYLEALEIRKNVLGVKHPYYATSLDNLALLYLAQKRYEKARQYYLEANRTYKEIYGEEHFVVATSMGNMASYYKTIGNYTEAETNYKKSLEIRKKVFGEKHPDYAISCNNLGTLYHIMGLKEKDTIIKIKLFNAALELYRESFQIRKEIYGVQHPDYAKSLNNLAEIKKEIGKIASSTEEKSKHFNEAEEFYLECIALINRFVERNFSFLSEKEREMYLKVQTETFSGFYSFAMFRYPEKPEIISPVFNNIIKNKGLLLKSATAMRTSILQSNDTSLIALYHEWNRLKQQIQKLSTTEIKKRKKDIELTEKEANEIEKVLFEKSSSFKKQSDSRNVVWSDIKKNLSENEVAIEFLKSSLSDTVRYFALLIKANSTLPVLVPLVKESVLEKCLNSNESEDYEKIANLYGTAKNKSNELYLFIWKPLEKYLKGINTVYLSPEGLMHKVSFSALKVNQDTFLIDLFNIRMMSSSSKIEKISDIRYDSDKVVSVFGGIDYSEENNSIQLWNYLPGTRNETDKIVKMLKDNGIKSIYKYGINATEEEFKLTSPDCDIIHISTHGFYFRDSDTIQETNLILSDDSISSNWRRLNSYGNWMFVKNKNSLMRSGLALAKANMVWNNRFITEMEDGVLTASEVAQLNLQKIQLAVLSACETGLGDIKGNEGVYGLQRAFKMAGVRFLIISLWQVPDSETEEFMALFYKNLLQNKDIKKSFSDTQTKMRNKYDPFYWGAFVLVE